MLSLNVVFVNDFHVLAICKNSWNFPGLLCRDGTIVYSGQTVVVNTSQANSCSKIHSTSVGLPVTNFSVSCAVIRYQAIYMGIKSEFQIHVARKLPATQ